MIAQNHNKCNGAIMRILVTGGSGFVGRHITERLVKDGHEVTITSTGSEPQIKGVHKVLYMGLDGIDWGCISGMDVVIHQMANNDTRCTDQDEMLLANLDGPAKLFRKAMAGGCEHFVYASSTAVYGAEPAPYDEDATEVKPLNVYGESKAQFERWAARWAKTEWVNIIGLRYCNVYGPGEHHKGKRKSMIGQLVDHARRGTQPKLFKWGEQKRDWIYVQDVVEANILAMQRVLAGPSPMHEIYNVGSGKATSFKEIVDVINHFYDEENQLIPEYVDCPFADQYQNYTECKMNKAEQKLGFVPKYDIRSGIKAYLHHFSGTSAV